MGPGVVLLAAAGRERERERGNERMSAARRPWACGPWASRCGSQRGRRRRRCLSDADDKRGEVVGGLASTRAVFASDRRGSASTETQGGG